MQIKGSLGTVFFILSANILRVEGAISSLERQLIQTILHNYTRTARPASPNTTINVTFGIEIVQIVDVNDRRQTITISAWVRQIWKNHLINWNPADFDGIGSVRMDPSSLWIPDIVLYNSAESAYSGGTEKYKTSVIMDSDGTNKWYCPVSFTSTCQIDITYFPFDSQTCKMKFGSWTFEVVELDMYGENASAYSSKYIQSAEWKLIEAKKVRHAEKYECCEHALADVTLELTIERKPLFYIFNLVLPCVIIITLVLLGFFLPPESGERITLCITTLLAMAVFLQLVSESLPRNSDTLPLLGVFFIVIMGEISISLILTCWVLNIHYRGTGGSTTEVPPWVRFIVMQWLGYLLCVARHNETAPAPDDLAAKKKRKVPLAEYRYRTSYPSSPSCHCNLCMSAHDAYHMLASIDQPDRRYSGYSTAEENIHVPAERRLRPTEQKMSADIGVLADEVRQRGVTEQNQEDWKYFAMVMDRLFFWLYVTTIVISTLSIFLQIPPRSSKYF